MKVFKINDFYAFEQKQNYEKIPFLIVLERA